MKNSATNNILFLKYLTNGYVASSSIDNSVTIWDPKTDLTFRRYTNHMNVVEGLDQIDNDTMVSAAYDRTIQIWRMSTGETLKVINTSTWARYVRVMPDRIHIACGLDSHRNNLVIYNMITLEFVRYLNGHTDTVYSLEILSDQYMASASADASVIVWDMISFKVKFNLTGIECLFIYL